MTTELDCRGLACPAPVLKIKELIEKENPSLVKVTVDNEAAKQNVSRFLGTQHFTVSVEQRGADFEVIGTRNEEAAPDTRSAEREEVAKKKILVMAASNVIGHGDDELGAKLMVSFLKTLKEMGDELWRLVFVNNGVKMTIDGSEVLPILRDLEGEGVSILVCGTCLSHFNLLERKQVGETTNMLDIVTAMQLADKVITI